MGLRGCLSKAEVCRAGHQDGQAGNSGQELMHYPLGRISSPSGKLQFCFYGLSAD